MAQSKKHRGLEAGALAVAGAVVAGYYFYGSKNAKKHRASTVRWAGDLKKQVVKEARLLSKVDKKKVGAIVDSVVRGYKAAKKADGKDLAKAATELKKNWHHLAAELKPLAGRAVSKGKGALKKATRTVKKTGKQISRHTKKAMSKKRK